MKHRRAVHGLRLGLQDCHLSMHRTPHACLLGTGRAPGLPVQTAAPCTHRSEGQEGQTLQRLPSWRASTTRCRVLACLQHGQRVQGAARTVQKQSRGIERRAWHACGRASSASSGRPTSQAHSNPSAAVHLRSSTGAAGWRPPGSACRSGMHRTWTLPHARHARHQARASAGRHRAPSPASSRRLCRC